MNVPWQDRDSDVFLLDLWNNVSLDSRWQLYNENFHHDNNTYRHCRFFACSLSIYI